MGIKSLQNQKIYKSAFGEVEKPVTKLTVKGSRYLAGDSDKIFLDDLRDIPDGWDGTDNIEEVIEALKTREILWLSLDHDLGEDVPTGYELVKRMVEEDVWPSKGIYLHSSNVVGIENMLSMLERYAPSELLLLPIDYLEALDEGIYNKEYKQNNIRLVKSPK